MAVYNDLPMYEARMNKKEHGITVISIVEEPAMESYFLKFSKEERKFHFSLDEEKRIITGVSLRANHPILRTEKGKQFYVIFREDAIEEIAHKFMKEMKNDQVTLAHNKDKTPVEDVYMVESFILNDGHRLNYSEFDDIDNGS